uniref:Thyroglobulin type-1 domain-containing protein n=1 Tax=Varanus komodoensis TaxID=61221 RepID=A0A8D2KSX8_VARKO
MKMGMVNMMPLALRDPESLQEEAKLTNSTEDQVKRVLLRGNPSRKFPELKQDFLDNMNQLRRHLGYEDWNAFENWMHKWLLFQLAQTETPKGKVKCNCREEECVEGVHPGKFCARCDENGDYLPEQCHGGTGYCWCVYKNGTMIKGTKVRGNPHCTGKELIWLSRGKRVTGMQVPVACQGERKLPSDGWAAWPGCEPPASGRPFAQRDFSVLSRLPGSLHRGPHLPWKAGCEGAVGR